MILPFAKYCLSTALCFVLTGALPFQVRGQQPFASGSSGSSGQGVPLSADELQ